MHLGVFPFLIIFIETIISERGERQKRGGRPGREGERREKERGGGGRGEGERGHVLWEVREHAKPDASDSGDGFGNVSGAGLDLTGSGHSSRRVRGL